jgi:hypothetical protein
MCYNVENSNFKRTLMATVTFDTLKFVEKLESAGITRERAKAEAEACYYLDMIYIQTKRGNNV